MMTPPKLISGPSLVVIHVVDFNGSLVTVFNGSDVDVAEVGKVALLEERLVGQTDVNVDVFAQLLLQEFLILSLALGNQFGYQSFVSLEAIDNDHRFHHSHTSFQNQFAEEIHVVFGIRLALFDERSLGFVEQFDEGLVTGNQLVYADLVDDVGGAPGKLTA